MRLLGYLYKLDTEGAGLNKCPLRSLMPDD
jgi:hypothetical protein